MLRDLAFAWPLMLALAVAMLQEPPVVDVVPLRAVEEPELTWSEQVAAVRIEAQTTIRVQQQRVTDSNVRDLAGLDHLVELELGQSELTAEGVHTLQTLPNFRRLTLRGRPVDDAMLLEICRIPTVRYLNLPHTTITDDGLVALDKRPQLVQLRLGSDRLTDAGLEHIAALPKLRFLHLVQVPFTDVGLAKLQKLSKLESLYIDDAQVTDDGLGKLIEALPELHLHINQQHHDRDPRKGMHVHP